MLNWFRRREESVPEEQTAEEARDLVPPDSAVADAAPQARAEDEQDGVGLEDSLEKTRRGLFGRIKNLFGQRADVDEAFFDELEELLIQADVGGPTTEKLVRNLRDQVRAQGISKAPDARLAFQDELAAFLEHEAASLDLSRPLTLILVVGVNGSGKTTSIGKLASHLIRHGHHVVLAAGDTFRAAAIEQLQAWGARAGVPVVSHQPGADPGAVIYDAIESAEARQADVVLADTAGRLHTKFNLMEELRKMGRVAGKRLPDAPHEVLLVLDATTGQNAIAQAKQFTATAGVTGVILTKLDSTAKGGMILAIREELGLPVKFVGTGEKIEDLAPFDPDEFAAGLFS